jgi:hypothetical protein
MTASRPWLKWGGIGCVGLLVLASALVAALFLFVRSATSGPEAVARTFFAAAAAGDYRAAHATFAAPLQESQPLEAFVAAAERHPSLFNVKDVSFTDRSIDLSGAKLAGTAMLASGTEVPVSLTFAREHDTWKILSYHIGSQD